MAIDQHDLEQAEAAMRARRESGGVAVKARHDRRVGRIVVKLQSGLELALAPRLAEGLADASIEDLSEIEITPPGWACIGRAAAIA